jgi:hypothetical protein
LVIRRFAFWEVTLWSFLSCSSSTSQLGHFQVLFPILTGALSFWRLSYWEI